MERKNELITSSNTSIIPQGVVREIILQILHRFSIEYDGQTERFNLNYNHGNGKLIQVKVSRHQ